MSDNNPGSTSPSAQTWENWSRNLVHRPSQDGTNYYFMPSSLTELKAVLAAVSKIPSATLRVSGQRHSQPPLVVGDNRDGVPTATTEYLVDLSCYADLGPSGDQRLILGPDANQVTVNAGVREDEIDAFLTQHNLMFQTVTAGGFFSVGGMAAVDVCGGTVHGPIFAETVASVTLLLADGTTTTIDAQTPTVGGWHPLQFARVSLGGLGILTSVTLDVLPRPYATTLHGGIAWLGLADKAKFAAKLQDLASNHTRLEIFFTPYATAWVPAASNFLVLSWDVVADPAQKTPNQGASVPTACTLANEPTPVYGAPDLGAAEGIAEWAGINAQSQYLTVGPAIIALTALHNIVSQVQAASAMYSDLWLNEAARVIFMSYYVPLPDLGVAGFGRVWDGLNVVSQIVTVDGNFHIAAPMEFRLMKGGDSAMSGTYVVSPDTWYVNLDLIGFVDTSKSSTDYPPQLMEFFADVERAWVGMGGMPHNGKMYGFYDPTQPPGTYSSTGPFNPNFVAEIRTQRKVRVAAFDDYRQHLDPNGLFCNKYLKALVGA